MVAVPRKEEGRGASVPKRDVEVQRDAPETCMAANTRSSQTSKALKKNEETTLQGMAANKQAACIQKARGVGANKETKALTFRPLSVRVWLRLSPQRAAWRQRYRARTPAKRRALGDALRYGALGSGRGDAPCSPRADSIRACPLRSSCRARARFRTRIWSCPCGSAHRRRRL